MLGGTAPGSDLGQMSPPRWPSAPGAPAGLMRRCLAIAVDLPIAVLLVIGPLVGFDHVLEALSIADGDTQTIWLIGAIFWLLLFIFCYSPLCISRLGWTPGKRAVGIEVVHGAGKRRIKYLPAVIRHVANIAMIAVPIFIIVNASTITLSSRRQGIHDKAVGSEVVYRRGRSRS